MNTDNNKEHKSSIGSDSFQKDREIFGKIKPKMRLADDIDFNNWQKQAYEKLYELLGLDLMEKCDDYINIEYKKNGELFTEIRLKFQSEPGYYVPCHMLIPNNVQKPYKPIICLQGHSSGMHISLARPKFEGDEETISGGDRDFAIRAVKEGYCAIAIEQRYMGECGGIGDEAGCVKGYARPTLLMGRCAIGERVWDIMRLIDVLYKHFNELDMERLICLGNSGGGTTTFYAASIDNRIKCAVPSCSVCTYKDSIVDLSHCSCNYIPSIARYFDMGDIAGLIAPRKLIVVNGREDNIFPEFGVLKAVKLAEHYFDACNAKQNLELVTGNGGHRFYADSAWPVIHNLMD